MLRDAIALATLGFALAAPVQAEEASARAAPSPTPGAARGLGDISFLSTDEPLVVQADRLELDYEGNRLVYKGRVHVVQGDFELRSKMLTVTFDRAEELERAELTRVVAQGDVVITQGDRRASGDRAVFDPVERQIILRGAPILRDGPNEVRGDTLTVYLDEGRSVVESGSERRVSAVLYPGDSGDRKETPSPSPAAPAGPEVSR